MSALSPIISSLVTRTGQFPIGFRLGFSEWQKILEPVIAWAKENNIGVMDLRSDSDKGVDEVRAAGLQVGSTDLLDWHLLISPDSGQRRDAVERNRAHIQKSTKSGPMRFFTVMIPENRDLPRRENFDHMISSYAELARTLEETDSQVVIEGWPGPGVLCCTPEGFRGLFDRIPSESIGVNYDPSHLVRMGIDPIRFLEEFQDRIYHVHAKDTLLLTDDLYEYGNLQPPTFAQPHSFGEMCWRYTIPGHGVVPWALIFQILEKKSYKGAVCIELEDENFNGTIESEKQGLLLAASFLASR